MSAFGMCFLGLLAMLIRNDYQCAHPAVLAAAVPPPYALAAPLFEGLALTNVPLPAVGMWGSGLRPRESLERKWSRLLCSEMRRCTTC